MVWVKCSKESSFLVFVCFESNAIQRLFCWFHPRKNIYFFKFLVYIWFGLNSAHRVLFWFLYVLSQMQYRDCFPAFSHKRIFFQKNFKFFVWFGLNAAQRVLFWFLYGLSQMQYRDFFPGFSHEKICFFYILRVCMVWLKCRTESSFLLFVCFESNKMARLISWFLP